MTGQSKGGTVTSYDEGRAGRIGQEIQLHGLVVESGDSQVAKPAV